MGQIYKPGELNREPLERIMIYGAPKLGKTRLALSIPRNEKWGKVAYIAIEKNSEDLKTVVNVDGVYVAKPGNVEGQPWDPLEEFVQYATMDWKSVDPEIKTIVVDSGTVMALDLLNAYAANDTVQKAHRMVGKKGTKSYHAQPDKSDFGWAQGSHQFILDHFANQPLHLIVLYHQDWVEPKSGSMDDMMGGPATVGFATIRTLPGWFDTVLRVTPGSTRRFAVQTERIGAWPAEIRNKRLGARLGINGVYDLNDDPSHFWADYDNFIAGTGPINTQKPAVSIAPQPTWT